MDIRMRNDEKIPKKVVAMAPYDRPWSNVELVKDCGLIPYLLYKNHGCEVRMVGARGNDYSYQTLVKGMELEFLTDGSVRTKMAYIAARARDIDLLILRGCYETNFGVAYTYKECNPEGKVYVGLDANTFWMDRIDWEDPAFQKFMDCCDVIATSGKAVRDYLNLKWPWRIVHIPNGYCDLGKKWISPPYAQKENIILTVGRLGTRQKATHIMLEAFAQVAEKIPQWRLRLAGTIEPAFQPWLEDYFNRYPSLRRRVEFVGSIKERNWLYAEYQRAKIFALSSDLEGGTPNVIAEALHAGCVIAITKIDACMEATDDERCGRVADIDDEKALGRVFLELATSTNLEEMSNRAFQYGCSHFNMENIVDKLYERLFGE